MTSIISPRIALAMGTIVAVSAALISSTGAFFSDTETSTGNTFSAGVLQVNMPTGTKFINATNMMPGDEEISTGEFEIVGDGGAFVKVSVGNIKVENDKVPVATVVGNTQVVAKIEKLNDDGTTTDVTGKFVGVISTSGYAWATGVGSELKEGKYKITTNYKLKDTAKNEMQGVKMTADVSLQAVQAKNNTNPIFD